MIFWTLFLPLTALFFILFFQFIDVIFRGKKRPFLIREKQEFKIPKREVYSTCINLLLFAGAGFLVGWAIHNNYSFVHRKTPSTVVEFLAFPFTFFLALGIHDLYFYCTHRLLHYGFIFKHVHIPHHKSHEVTPWSAFSFHPVEAIVQIGIIVLLAFFLPMHEGVLIAFSVLLFLISVYGHCGYELRVNKWEGFNVFNTSFHHYQHHKEVHYNFGLYLNVWDKLFRTSSPNYDRGFNALKKSVQQKQKDSSIHNPIHGE